MLVYVLKKKREHATYNIRDSYYKPVSLSSLRFLPPGVGLTGSSRPSKVLLEFKVVTEHKQTQIKTIF